MKLSKGKSVFDFNKDEGLPFGYDFCIFYDGSLTCASANAFERNVAEWDSLTEDEKAACRGFVDDMDEKYGPGEHDYRVPETV